MGLTSLAKGMGMTDKAAVELSGEFSKMSVDIGSFMMRDPEQVMGAFQSALMGNTIALRNYGVFLNETLLKETVAANAKKGVRNFPLDFLEGMVDNTNPNAREQNENTF